MSAHNIGGGACRRGACDWNIWLRRFAGCWRSHQACVNVYPAHSFHFSRRPSITLPLSGSSVSVLSAPPSPGWCGLEVRQQRPVGCQSVSFHWLCVSPVSSCYLPYLATLPHLGFNGRESLTEKK